jgi:SNF2 family DNA or RNA helicase
MKAKQRDIFKVIVTDDARERKLDVVSVNIEAVRKGNPIFNELLRWMRKQRVMMVIDEATRISSPSAAQTKGALKLGANAAIRRLATGTLTAGGPFRAFAPMLFLSPDILGDNFTAFKAEYCEMMPPENGLVRYIAAKKAGSMRGEERERFIRKMQSIIQLPKRTPDGALIYKNIDRLHAKIAGHSFRVLKDECLDLPPKIYMPLCYVDLTATQREIYEQVRTEVIAEFVHDREIRQITIDMAIKRLLRLQQIVCNHYTPDPDIDAPRTPPQLIEPKWEDVPRIQSLLQVIEDADPQARGIIWCRFHPEIAQIAAALSEKFGAARVVQLHGKMKKEDQVASRKSFLDLKSPTQWIIGQVRSGIGIDLYTAQWEYFYSNDWSLENRLQAEDRGHRIGLKNKLLIFDAYARDCSVEDRLINTLRQHKDVHEMIMGDNPRNWI